MTKLNPNSLQAFLLKKKEQNQPTLVPQSQPVSKPQLTAPPPEESVAEVNTGESVVVEESKAEEMTGVVTNVIESEAVGNHAEMQEPPSLWAALAEGRSEIELRRAGTMLRRLPEDRR